MRPAQARLLRTSVGGSSAAAEARFGVRGADECHALAAQREGAQRIKQGSGGNGRSVGSGQWVGSGPRGHRADGDGCRGRPLSAVCRAMRWPFGARGRRGSSKAAGATAEAWAAASGWAAGRGRGHRADGVGCRGEPLSTYAAPCVGRSAHGGAEDRARQRGQRPKRAQQPGGGQRAEEGVQLRAPCCRRT